AARRDYPAGIQANSVAIGDLNGDGKPDLAVADYSASPPYTVSTMLGRGDGTLLPAAFYEVGQNPAAIAIGDLNADGKMDVADACYGSGAASVLPGRGTGSLPVVPDYLAGTEVWAVALGDLNGDGKPDLAVANRAPGTVSTLLGIGDATFAGHVDHLV